MNKPTMKKGLGRGLSALLSEAVSVDEASDIVKININDIVPCRYQPRTHFTESSLKELSESITEHGLLQPILVRKRQPANDDLDAKQYELIAGERRWRACKMAGLRLIPAIIKSLDNKEVMASAMIENIQRENLSPVEEAHAYKKLLATCDYTQEQLARIVKKSRSHISNLLRLLDLPESIHTLVNEQKISMGHARALLNTDAPEVTALKIINEGLSVRQVEKLGKRKRKSSHPSQKPISLDHHNDADIKALEEMMSQSLNLPVRIKDGEGDDGLVVLSFKSLEQLDRIIKRLS